jgi:arabinose-5-phosphate isomerase
MNQLEDFTPPIASEQSSKLMPKTGEVRAALNLAKEVLTLEADSIQKVSGRLNESFVQAVELLNKTNGKVIVTGLGKSGYIGEKIAATLSSTGTPAFFVHPTELQHGDFGRLEERDLVIALSYSGETQEIKFMLDHLKRIGLKIISITGNLNSTLARASDISLDAGVEREACPLNLAPTSSTTVALALGDALAIVLMTRKGFKAEDFARSHPGGSLGRNLVRVQDIMHTGSELALVNPQTAYLDILKEITNKGLGFAVVLDQEKRTLGIVTDGDLRRAQLKFGKTIDSVEAEQIMSKEPKTIEQSALAVEALKLFEKHPIGTLLIQNSLRQPVGCIELKDLVKAGII